MYPDVGTKLAWTGMRNKLFILHGHIRIFWNIYYVRILEYNFQVFLYGVSTVAPLFTRQFLTIHLFLKELIGLFRIISMASKIGKCHLVSEIETIPSKRFKIEMDQISDPASDSNSAVSNEKIQTIKESEYFAKPVVGNKSKKTNKKTKKEPQPITAPPNWKEIYDNIVEMREDRSAPVDSMGVQSNLSDNIPPNESRFHVLFSLILSSRTKDTVNSAVMNKLREYGLTVEHIRNTSVEKLTELIHSVGFKNTKAKHIKKVVEILHEQYADDVPGDYESILALPGVGPKMALLMMSVAWNKTVGISVDIHVHRISNRLKWTGARATSRPEQTRKSLEDWLPREYWGEVNGMLVGFGQQICKNIPLCSTCLNRKICPSSNYKK